MQEFIAPVPRLLTEKCTSLEELELNSIDRFSFKRKVKLLTRLIKMSKIIGCTLERFGELPHEFEYGACGTFIFEEETIMFCFGEADKKKCFRFLSDCQFLIVNISFLNKL